MWKVKCLTLAHGFRPEAENVCLPPPPAVTPHTRCRLKLLKLERIKDFLLMEEELIRNQERLRPQEVKNEVSLGGLCLHRSPPPPH